jgi:LPXTG-motif cell wall-anchored protein
MRRVPALALAAACAVAPVLWAASPASAEPGYPPTGPSGGGGTVTSTLGGGGITTTVPTNLPHTGTDLVTPALAGGASVLLGVGLLLLRTGRRATRRTAAPTP